MFVRAFIKHGKNIICPWTCDDFSVEEENLLGYSFKELGWLDEASPYRSDLRYRVSVRIKEQIPDNYIYKLGYIEWVEATMARH
jgi:hypothetical protein